VYLATIGLMVAASSAGQPPVKQSSVSLTRVYIDHSRGDVHLVLSNGKDVLVKKWTESVSDARIAADKTSIQATLLSGQNI